MEIILHTGAHRTATTSFQHWLRNNRAVLAAHGTVVWDPVITREEPFVLFGIPLDEAKDTRGRGRPPRNVCGPKSRGWRPKGSSGF